MERVGLALALSDLIPPLLYLAGCFFVIRTMRALGERELSGMFMAGSALAFLSGIGKVAAKLQDAAAARPVTESGFLYDQMFPVMAVGFLATAAAIILGARRYSGRDERGRRTRVAEVASWVSPFLGGLALGLSLALVIAANAEPSFRPFLVSVKRASMIAMIVLQLATVGILGWFCLKEGSRIGGALGLISLAAMLAMGALGSPSMQARFADRLLLNWIAQAVNVVAQASFAAAAYAIWARNRVRS